MEGEVSSDGPESDVIFDPSKGGDHDQADEDQTMGQQVPHLHDPIVLLNAIEASATREGEVSTDGAESDVIFNPIKGVTRLMRTRQ